MREGTSIPSPYLKTSYIAIFYKRLIVMNCRNIPWQPFKYDSTHTSDEYLSRSQVFSYLFSIMFFSEYKVIYFHHSSLESMKKPIRKQKLPSTAAEITFLIIRYVFFLYIFPNIYIGSVWHQYAHIILNHFFSFMYWALSYNIKCFNNMVFIG